LLWACGALPVLPPAASGSYMLPPIGYRAKDFAFIRHEGLYHLFYTRRNVSVPPDSTEKDLGHAVSADLISWTHLAPVLPARPDNWDNRHIWAPHIVESDGIFYMFYTGVNQTPGVFQYHQRIGLATSTDLLNWNRLDEPVFSCEDAPWTYCNRVNANTSIRDAFVMPDAQAPGEWWMYYSTSLAEDSTSMIAGIAGTADLGGSWGNVGPLAVTGAAVSSSALCESVHLFDHGGLWFAVWTTNKSQPLVWASSPDPVGRLSAWTYRGTLASMLGIDTSPWFASEHLRDGLVDYFAAASLTAIEILRMDWTSPTTFQLKQPSAFHVRGMWWSRAAVAEGDTAALTVHSTGWFGQSAEIEVLEVDADGVETLVPNHEVGLPDAIPLSSNQTVYTWTARGHPDAGDGEDGPELVVRVKDRTAIAPMIRVAPAAQGGSDLEDDISGGFKIGFMRGSPLGAAFRIDMPAPGPARLDLFDVGGRRLATLHDGLLPAGVSVVRLGAAARGWSPGVYFARVETALGRRAARFVLMP
jgi:hypothetical protein